MTVDEIKEYIFFRINYNNIDKWTRDTLLHIESMLDDLEDRPKDIKQEEIYWEYNGSGNDLGTELEIRCIYCNAFFRISSPDENKPFSYFTTRQNLDEYAPRECPQCKHKMIGYKILSHEIGIGAKPDEMRYFKEEPYERKE